MKKLILAASVLAATSVGAQELSFGDLNFFLKPGQFNLTADVDLVSNEFNVKPGDKFEVEGYQARSRLAYGVTEKINIFALVGYDLKNKTVNESDSTEDHYYNDGLLNPALGGTWRVMNQTQDRYNVDLTAIASFKVEDAEKGDAAATSSEDGNAADARNSVEFNARMGRKWNEANEWQFTVGGIYRTDGDYDQLQAGGASASVDLDSSMDVYAKAAYQYRPVHVFMINVGIQATQIGKVEGDVAGSDLEDDSHLDMDFTFQARYLLSDNFILRFNMAQGNNSSFDRDIAGTKTEFNRRHESSYGLGIDWLI